MQETQYVIEKIAYDENCDGAIKQALLDRVYILEPGVVYFKQIPLHSTYSLDLMFDEMFRLGKSFEKWSVIIDLTEASRPDAQSRRKINQTFKRLTAEAVFIGFYTKGLVLNTIIRFVMYGLKSSSYTVSTDYATILSAARKSVR